MRLLFSPTVLKDGIHGYQRCAFAVAVSLVLCLSGLACRPADTTSKTPSLSRSAENQEKSSAVTIAVAASAKEAIAELSSQFEATHKAHIKIIAGPSSGLANQIIEGAPVDLFLSANTAWADEVKKSGLALAQVPLLANQLVLVVPANNKAEVKSPTDLLLDSVKKIALAAEKVPAGEYAEQALTKLELMEPLKASGKIVRGQDVRSALAYVERGEVEAGIAYATDVNAARGIVQVFAFDPALHDKIIYALVKIGRSESNPMAGEFYEYLQSESAARTFEKFGFQRLTTSNDNQRSNSK